MKNLLLTLSCVSVLAIAGQANAQSAAQQAAEAARAAGAATKVGTAASRSTVELGTGVSAGTAAARSAAEGLLNTRATESAVAGTCTTTVMGKTDVRQAQALGVTSAASVCRLNLSEEALEGAAVVVNAIANDLRGVPVARASLAQKARALHAGAEALEARNGLSDEKAEANTAEITKKCDFLNPALGDEKVISAMKAID